VRILTFTTLIALVFQSCNNRCDAVKSVREREIEGVIKKKYRLSWNHNSKELDIYKNSRKILGIYFFSEESGLWDFVQIGDSLHKERESFDVRIYRAGMNPQTFTLQYPGCE
jgi:hypothetical protein